MKGCINQMKEKGKEKAIMYNVIGDQVVCGWQLNSAI